MRPAEEIDVGAASRESLIDETLRALDAELIGLEPVKFSFIWNDALAHGKTVCDSANSPPTTRAGKIRREGRTVFSTPSVISSTVRTPLPMRANRTSRHCGRSSSPIRLAGIWTCRTCGARNNSSGVEKFEAADNLPNLVILWLPNDHTSGTKAGSPTPAAQVADNDLAMGQVVEAVSHSKFWKDTCIVAVEDDPQNGWDHVSGYRTTAYVISACTKRHAVISTQYNQTSLLRTMELMLGLPPMNQMDATATPMFDCFTNTPDFTAFDAVTNTVPLDEMNPAPRKFPTRNSARTRWFPRDCRWISPTNARRTC